MRYYEIHKKNIYEVFAESEREAIELAMDNKATLKEQEFYVESVSEEVED